MTRAEWYQRRAELIVQLRYLITVTSDTWLKQLAVEVLQLLEEAP